MTDESITFWLDNRKCAGIKAALIGNQHLVLYRDRYYVVSGGAAQTRAGKPLRFSTSSLPSAWKLALKGEMPVSMASVPEPSPAPTTRKPQRQYRKAEKPAMPESHKESTPVVTVDAPDSAVKPKRKSDAKPAPQSPVAANCPYCNARHEIPVEKGKGGKPFFVPCTRCAKEFAVRFVQVTMYKAQVAGFL